jgi:hypothetical protein
MNDIDKMIAKKYTIDQFVSKKSMDSSGKDLESLLIERDNALNTMDIISTETLNYINTESPSASNTLNSCTISTSDDRKKLTKVDAGVNHTSKFEKTGMLIHLTRDNGGTFENIEAYLLEPATYNALFSTTTAYLKPANSAVEIPNGTENYTVSFYKNMDPILNKKEDEFQVICDGLIHKAAWDAQVYGIEEKIESINKKSDMCEKMYEHATDTVDSYFRFSNWGDGIETGVTEENKPPIFDDNISYDSDNTFKILEDKTGDLYLNREILIDCGEDGFTSGEIVKSTYYPPSAGNYTEVSVVPDFINYSFLNENIIEMKINGNVVYPIPSFNLFTNTNWLSAGGTIPPDDWDIIGDIIDFNIEDERLIFTANEDEGISQNISVTEGKLISLSIDSISEIKINVYDIENENYIIETTSLDDNIEFIIPHACENIRVEFLSNGGIVSIKNPEILYRNILNLNEDMFSFWFYGNEETNFTLNKDIIITFSDGIVKKGLIRESFYYDEYYDDGMYTYIRVVPYCYIVDNITSINEAISAGSTILEPVSGGIEFIDETRFKIEGDQTSFFVEDKEGIWLTMNDEYSFPFKVTSSEHKTGDSDYTLVTFNSNDNTSGLPITENIQKIYVLPE